MYAMKPGAPLSALVDHYWLSWNNTAVRHAVLPDGCVDVVIECLEGDARCWAFGTTTQRRQLEVRPGAHYLGVRFRAGQGRHVLSVAAGELTDTRLPASEGTRLPLERVVEALQRASLPTREPFEVFERALWAYLERQPPAETVLDAALRLVDERSSQVRVGELAAQLGISRRHLERLFTEHVGVSPKQYLNILRCTHAWGLLQRGPHSPLSRVAHEAGFADQSHMNREVRRLLAVTPGQIARGDA